MSGEKETSVSVSQSTYNDLMRKARKANEIERREIAVQAQLDKANRNLQWQRDQQARQQAAFDKAVNSLSSELQSATRKFQQELASQKAQFQGETQRLDRRLDMQAAFVKAQFDDLKRVEKNKEAHARQWLDDARVMLGYINELPHHKFARGKLDGLEQKFNISKSNLLVDFGAALSTAQSLHNDALELIVEIQQKQSEWNAFYKETEEGARKLLAEVEVQQAAEWLMDFEGGSEKIAAEVDYWSDGELGRLQHQISESLRILERDKDALGVEDLKASLDKQNSMADEIEKCVSYAKERLIASQLRVGIAGDVLAELAGAGWKLEDSAWEGEQGDDGKGWKNSYHMKLRDMGNNEIIAVIVPEQATRGTIENRLQFAYYPKDYRDARFASAQTSHLNGIIKRLGLTDKNLDCVPGHERTIRGNSERQDFQRLRSSSVAKANKPIGQSS